MKISQSTIEDASLKDCDIEGCQISKGKFSGLWLRNGVWEDGELVGEVRKGEGVVLKAKNFAEIEEREKERERERTRRAEGEKCGQERGIGIGGGTKGGMEDPVPIPASAGAQGDNVLLVGISSGEASGFICPPQGNFMVRKKIGTLCSIFLAYSIDTYFYIPIFTPPSPSCQVRYSVTYARASSMPTRPRYHRQISIHWIQHQQQSQQHQ